MANQHLSWDGRVVFETVHTSRRVDKAMRALVETAKQVLPDEVDSNGDLDIGVNNAIWVVVHTQDITFDWQDNESAMLLDLETFWNNYQKTADPEKQVELIQAWYDNTHINVYLEWVRAVEKGNKLFIDPAIAAPELLSEDQKAELDAPDSPLDADGKTNSEKSTSSSKS